MISHSWEFYRRVFDRRSPHIMAVRDIPLQKTRSGKKSAAIAAMADAMIFGTFFL